MKSFGELQDKARQKDEYWIADAIYSFTEELNRIAEIEGISRAELARRLGTSAAYVTKIFRGDVNFTVESMVRLARAVGARFHVHLALEGRHFVDTTSATMVPTPRGRRRASIGTRRRMATKRIPQ